MMFVVVVTYTWYFFFFGIAPQIPALDYQADSLGIFICVWARAAFQASRQHAREKVHGPGLDLSCEVAR